MRVYQCKPLNGAAVSEGSWGGGLVEEGAGVEQILSCKRGSINRDKSPQVLVIPVPGLHHYVYIECVGVYKSALLFRKRPGQARIANTM